MTKKIKVCEACGNEVQDQMKVPGYKWVIAENYSWGHWVKLPREKKNARIKKEDC